MLVVASLLALVGLGQAPASGAAPRSSFPVQPSDYSLFYEFMGPGSTGAQSVVSGDVYSDATDARVRTDEVLRNGEMRIEFFFYDKHRSYTYDPQTNTCAEAPLTTSLVPGYFGIPFSDLSSLSARGQVERDGQLLDRWVGRPGGVPLTVDVTQGPGQPVVIKLAGYGPYVSEEWIVTSFTSGQPDAAVFNLPVACVS